MVEKYQQIWALVVPSSNKTSCDFAGSYLRYWQDIETSQHLIGFEEIVICDEDDAHEKNHKKAFKKACLNFRSTWTRLKLPFLDGALFEINGEFGDAFLAKWLHRRQYHFVFNHKNWISLICRYIMSNTWYQAFLMIVWKFSNLIEGHLLWWSSSKIKRYNLQQDLIVWKGSNWRLLQWMRKQPEEINITFLTLFVTSTIQWMSCGVNKSRTCLFWSTNYQWFGKVESTDLGRDRTL